MMNPGEAIEYVVVNDLIHLEEPNHSDKFSYKFRKILPDYKERRKWLKDNSPELVLSGEDVI